MRTKIIYLHGLNSSKRSFNYLLSQIGPQEGDILIDYNSRQELELSIQQVMRSIPKKEPITVIGHSLGGVIALLIASRGMANVEKVVTISSPVGGSRFAVFARWVATGIPLLGDITPNARHIVELKNAKFSMPVLSIISTGGALPTSTEPNDSVVSVSSQKALSGPKKIQVNANHFEILLHEDVVNHISKFIDTMQ